MSTVSVGRRVKVRGRGFGLRSRVPQHAAAFDSILSAEHDLNRFPIGDVLLLQDAVRQVVIGIAFENRDDLLQDDGAVVEVFVDEVYSASGELNPVLQGLL